VLAYPSVAAARSRDEGLSSASYEDLAVACLGRNLPASDGGWLEKENVLIRVRDPHDEDGRSVAEILETLAPDAVQR
jgi:hypothetical protein